jgi:hypothetical protein
MGFMGKRSFVLAGGLALACSSSSSGTSLTAAQACGDEASAVCNKVSSCYPLFFQYLFADMATCTNGFSGNCTGALSASGTSSTPSSIEACAQAVNGLACADALSALADNDLPPACQPAPGALADGAACGDSAQCAHQYCKIGKNATCGACSSRAAAGAPCTTNNDCEYGLVCPLPTGVTTGTCITPVAAGAKCDPAHSCAGENICSAGTCAAPGKPGDTCDFATQGLFCDAEQLVVCLPIQNTCVQGTVAQAGQGCGLTGANTVAVCAGGGENQPTSDCTTSANGTCQAQVPNGGSCTPGAPQGCIYPAVCENGVCTLPNAGSCH